MGTGVLPHKIELEISEDMLKVYIGLSTEEG